MSNDMKDLFNNFSTAASQVQNRHSEEQKKIYKNGPWWNFLPFVVTSSNNSHLFDAAEKAMMMQCIMYGNCVKTFHIKDVSKKDLEEIVYNNSGRKVLDDSENCEYIYIFERALLSFKEWNNSLRGAVSDEKMYETLMSDLNKDE